MTKQLSRTVFFDRQVAAGAKIVEFAGWQMALHYAGGIVEEHLATRKRAGLFDVSHMGRFIFRGRDALGFLQHALTNNAASLEVGQAQYTMISNAAGGAIDDAYLYRFVEDEYLLVLNAANLGKDRDHFQTLGRDFGDLEVEDITTTRAMLALQGPLSKHILGGLIDSGSLPDPMRNKLSIVQIGGVEVWVGRTGYTGEPLCFEMFIKGHDAPGIWDLLIDSCATPVGLGARDTLRLEAALPLYGHELGTDPEGKEIPIFACPLAPFAVSFSPLKGDFVGREALDRQHEAYKRIIRRDYRQIEDLPQMVRTVTVLGRGIARQGDKVFVDGKRVGYVTSGTMVPYWKTEGEGLRSRLTDDSAMRAITLALIDSNLVNEDRVDIQIRGKAVEGVIVPYHMRSDAPPLARPIVRGAVEVEPARPATKALSRRAIDLLQDAAANTIWRQSRCINLIPSEQTVSSAVRMLSIMDPVFRYAEHKQMHAFDDAEVFYYQGTDFICRVEQMLEEQMREFLGCGQVETRAISGQMANAAVFSAMVDYINRGDRRSEQRRMRCVMNNNIIKGGHLSAQPMGALRDFVARDPQTEKPSVVNFPVTSDDPYRIDTTACAELIEQHRPELIIFGKSMVLYPEPIAEIKAILDDLGLAGVIMYDAAHVLGLLGPHFQQPFREGADLVTGSTHKTFFGTQRGVIASNYHEPEEPYALWEAIRRRIFPGSVSNHHLGTMVGLLLAAYEMNHFKDTYQQAVLTNAKAFAKALADLGMDVAGDPQVGYTQTHQVVVHVGDAQGPVIAQRLEENNIIVNYQASPLEEGFTASGALRMGVSEMTRFGMGPEDFQALAELMHDAVVNNRNIKDKVTALRKRFRRLGFCFTGEQMDEAVQELHKLV